MKANIITLALILLLTLIAAYVLGCNEAEKKPADTKTVTTTTTTKERIITVVQKVQDNTGWLVTVGIIVVAGGVVLCRIIGMTLGGAVIGGGLVLVLFPMLLPVLAQEFMTYLVWGARIALVGVVLAIVYKYRLAIIEVAHGVDQVIKPSLGKKKDEVMSKWKQSPSTQRLIKAARKY
jgi:hypothetical protein